MADVLVTGATGLVGSHLVPRLAAGGHRVVALARRPPAGATGATWVEHDLSRPGLPPGLPPRIDGVVHLAQGREFRDFPAGAPSTFAVNVGSTALLLDWAVRAGARQFVLASTGGVYRDGPQPHTEDEPVRLPADGLSFYVATKLAAEALALAYGAHMAVTVLRPFFVYGPGQEQSMLLPRLVTSIREGRAVPLDGTDGLRLNPVHAADAAGAVVAALSLDDGGIVNVAGPQVMTLREVAELLARALGTTAKFEVRGARQATNVIGDTTRMRARLVPPRMLLADAVGELCSRVASPR